MHIDWWTLALQAINVIVLLWLLKRFLMQPVAKIIAERQTTAAGLLADAEAAKSAAAEQNRQAAEERALTAAARAEALKEAAAEAERVKAAMVADGRAQADRIEAAAKAEAERYRQETEADLVEHAKQLAADLTRRLLARLPEEARVAGFIDGVASALRSLPPESLALIGDHGAVPVRAPRPLTDAEADALRAALAGILGRRPEITITADPALLAGLEIETPHAVVRNSFRSDLDRLVKELARHG